MKIAVTGASGHIGANLIRLLIEKGHEVVVLYFHDDVSFKSLNLRTVKGSILDKEALKKLIYGSEIVYHLAAAISINGDRSGNVQKVNIEGTRNVVDICFDKNVGRLIHFSSIHAFQQYPLNEQLDETRGLIGNIGHSYDMSKSAGEKIVFDAVGKGLDALVLSPTSVVGPYDFKPSLMGQLLIKLYNKKLPALVSGGYDWVDVRDIAFAAYNAIEKGVKGEKYLLSGSWDTVKNLAMLTEKVTGVKAPKLICPNWLAKAGIPILNMADRIKGDTPLYTKESLDILVTGNRNICCDKAKQNLDVNPRPFIETLIDTYKWFKENNYIS
jgi:dihydroflavonol-4-reductase